MTKYRIIEKFSDLYKKRVIVVQEEIEKSYPNSAFYYNEWQTIKNKKTWFFGSEEEKTFDSAEEAEKYIEAKTKEEKNEEELKTSKIIKEY
jgi:hypothetical protein